MNKEEIDFKEQLQAIAQVEGEEFEFDEVEIEQEYSKLNTDKSNLAIKVLTIFGGFLATLAFLGFLAIAGLYNSKAGLVVVGVIFIAIAIYLNFEYNKLIIDTLSVSAYALGYCLIAFGLGTFDVSLLFIIIALATLFITQGYIISFVSVLIINGSILFFIVNNHAFNAIHIYNAFILFLLTSVFLNEAKLITQSKKISKLYNPVRIGLIMSVIMGLIFVGNRHLYGYTVDYFWISSFITIPLTIYVISIITKVIGINQLKTQLIIYTLSTLILLPTAISPAISGALLIILLSFLVNYKIGLSIGVIMFIYFISQFYYDLDFTLLTKSILMFSTGIIFLLFYFLTSQKQSTDEKV